jgi:hypothetical protein
MPEYPGGQRPDSPGDFYLLANLDELRAIRAHLEVSTSPQPPAPAKRAPRTQKVTSDG